MQSLPTTLSFRLNLRSSPHWWTRRPWADSMLNLDTAAFVPGRHHAAPLLRASRPKRTRRAEAHPSWHARPSQASSVRRGLDGPGAVGTSLRVPAAVKLVDEAEAARLEQARRSIDFRPKNGFLHSTRVGRLRRDA